MYCDNGSIFKPTSRNLVRYFWPYLRPDQRACLLSLGLMAFTLAFELSRPFLLKSALDCIAGRDGAGLRLFATIFFAMLILEYFCRSGFNYLLSIVLLKMIHRIRVAIFHHAIHLKAAYYDHHPVGGLLTRTVSDTEALRETLRAGAATILLDILTVLGMFAVMVKLDLNLSLIMMATGLLVWLVVRWFGQKLHEQYLAVQAILARSNAFMAEGIAGVEIIQLFHYHGPSCRQFSEINRDYCQATVWRNVYDAGLYSAVDGIAALVSGLILYLGFGMQFGLIEVSAMIVYLNLIERIFIPIRDLSGKFATIQQSLAALHRIYELLSTPEHIPQGHTRITGDPLHIEFDRVCFSYHDEGPRVLHEVSFTVRPGETVALVGATGSGKSTIGKLLIRAYDGYTGSIRIAGSELKDTDHYSLRSRIAVIPQDVNVFPGTICDNITMFNESITQPDIYQAIRFVKAEEMISQLPERLQYEVKENGANLSSGQLQLIAFARALAHNAPVILMDEATSNVDSLTEAWIQQAVQQIFKSKTVLIIAHRLSTITSADLILVLKDGRIIQRGNHETLLQEKDGYYAQLVRSARQNSVARKNSFNVSHAH